jgi:RimJ/RimL family protein N-acetyltransferase
VRKAQDMITPNKIRFQKLQFDDLPLMQQWLNTDFVTEWYSGEPTTLEGIREEYGPLIDGRDPTQAFLIIYDTTPIGYIQTYKFRDNPEWQAVVQPAEEAAGIDLFIGHPGYIHRGAGSFIIKKFLQEIVFSQPEIEICVIDPEPANKVAIRAYEKAGFTYWKTIPAGTFPNEPEGYWLRLTKADFLAGLDR